jgi:acyl carrier protein
MALRDDILEVLRRGHARIPDDIDDDTSLIRSGLVDSTALFDLALWIEERVVSGLDLATFDLAEEWDTLGKLLAFIDRQSGTPTS